MNTSPQRPAWSPEESFAELFAEVQLSHLLPDSKSFVDAVPKSDPAEILARYRNAVTGPGFDLRRFIDEHFDLPQPAAAGLEANASRPVREHIDALWDALARNDENARGRSSRIALPHPYVVPGGRFREIYYWDSYFTMLGLASSGRVAMVEHMVANFACLIDVVGFIPNGNRSYFCTRSQPPFFALMVELLANCLDDESIYVRYLPQLEREHAFWMKPDEPPARAVTVDGETFNRYWDSATTPRPESYAEDVELMRDIDDEATRGARFREIRAACESGWDFSSRWLVQPHDLATIRTSHIVPVDLACLLHELERVLAKSHAIAGDNSRSQYWQKRAGQRADSVRQRFFGGGFFHDLLLPQLETGGVDSLAALFPLFCNIATAEQAGAVAARLRESFLQPGGWQTTQVVSGQQWDAPSGWAPLQWICYRGLMNYGYDDDARKGATRWVNNNLAVYRESGRLLERYNVVDVGALPPGGEYTVQDGFGWTNGVLLCLLDELHMP